MRIGSEGSVGLRVGDEWQGVPMLLRGGHRGLRRRGVGDSGRVQTGD